MDVHSNYSSDEILPRVLIVSRRTIRKNKFVDFVGEYHLDLIVKYGAVPIIVPRVTGIHSLLSNFDPIHGVLLCEGEDIDPSHYNTTPTSSTLTSSELDEIRSIHISDTSIDTSKDSIELNLAKLCLQRNIPYLGICRGSQVINVACGGTLYQDVEMELHNKMGKPRVVHMDYENYDGHRHVVRVEQGTPLADWFSEEWEDGEEMELMVNSYHHQGVKKLADRFVPMAFAEDGLIEGFYDRDGYDPGEGKFIMGLQFHPERMRKNNDDGEFDYAGCPTAYKEFVRAVMAYEKKVRINATATTHVPRGMFNISPTTKINWEMENKRKIIVRSFSLEKDMYIGAGYHHRTSAAASEGNILEENTTALISLQQEQRLKQMGATVRNGCAYLGSLKKMNDEKERIARSIIGKMSTEHLSEMVSFYYMMGQICSEVFETKIKLHSM